MSGTPPASLDLRLSCEPAKTGGKLIFPYTIANNGSVDAYVMDALPGVDGELGAAVANSDWAVVLAGPGEDVTVARMVAPSPTDRRIAMPVIPLARRLGRGETLQACITIPEPLAETSPYFADLPLRRYAIVAISGVVVSIGYWRADSESLVAQPVDFAPGLFRIVTPNTVRSAQAVTQRFPARGLQLFRRTDEFPRLSEAAVLAPQPAA